MTPQLHISALNMLWRCGEQFRRRYIKNEIRPPNSAIIVGKAVDTGVTVNLGHKIEDGSLLEPEQVADVARDAVNGEWSREVMLDEEERDVGPRRAKGMAVDRAVRLARCHALELAPALEPTAVQRPFTLELPGYGIELAGTMDIQEGAIAVRDTKTGRKSPARDAADTSDQLTMYALAVRILDGKAPQRLVLDHVVDLKSGPVLRILETMRTDEDFQVLLRRVENAIESINKGVFLPARQDDWWCSEKWCGYATTCPYYRRRR